MVKTLIYLIHLMGIQGQPLSNPTCMKGMMWQIMIWNTMGLLHSEFLSIIQLIKNIYAEIYLYYSMLCSVIVKARMVSSELKKSLPSTLQRKYFWNSFRVKVPCTKCISKCYRGSLACMTITRSSFLLFGTKTTISVFCRPCLIFNK